MPADGCDFIARPVVIHDAAETPPPSSTSTERVRAVARPVLGADFLDEEEVESRCVPELVELVLRATAGESAHVFDTQLRRRELGRPPMTLGARSGPFAGPAGRVHVDYTEASGEAARKGLAGPRAAPSLLHRERVAVDRPGAGARYSARPL